MDEPKVPRLQFRWVDSLVLVSWLSFTIADASRMGIQFSFGDRFLTGGLFSVAIAGAWYGSIQIANKLKIENSFSRGIVLCVLIAPIALIGHDKVTGRGL